MIELFKEAALAGLTVKNRFVRSATHEGLADNKGRPLEELRKLYINLARGGVGTIITGYAVVHPSGKSHMPAMLMMDRDELIYPFSRMTAAVKKEGSRIIMQLAHCGRQTYSSETGLPKVAPSAIRDRLFSDSVPLELTEEGIEEIIESFVKAIGRAKRAGFDGVQIHAAHGYLLSSFLSGYSNRREDHWGGTQANRARILVEIIRRARAEVDNYPILIKMNGHDAAKGGTTIEEAVETARILEEAGYDAIEVSCGIAEDGFNTSRHIGNPADGVLAAVKPYKNFPSFLKLLMRPFIPLVVKRYSPVFNYNAEAGAAIKRAVKIPVLLVGGLNRLDDMQRMVKEGSADFISLSRPLILQPDLVKRLEEGKQERARCIYCNYCMLGAFLRPTRCYYGQIKKSST